MSPSTHPTLESIADVLIEEVRAVHPSGPYWIGGHCWGGIVAHHMTSRLEALGEEVKGLFLMESFVPLAAGHQCAEDASAVVKLHVTMQEILAETLADTRNKLARMPKAHIDRLVELTANQIQTSAVYTPANIQAPARLFRTDANDPIAFEGWRSLCSGAYSVQAVTGATHSMLEAPHVKTLCSELEAFLAACD